MLLFLLPFCYNHCNLDNYATNNSDKKISYNGNIKGCGGGVLGGGLDGGGDGSNNSNQQQQQQDNLKHFSVYVSVMRVPQHVVCGFLQYTCQATGRRHT